jgi:Protein of unknown function (DUF1638)
MIHWICCGVIRNEINELLRCGKIQGSVEFLDSMLHMDPLCLDSRLEERIKASIGYLVILLYGDCCPKMFEFSQLHNVKRIKAINCVEMLLGKSTYRAYMQKNAFIFLPEWALRWREVFQTELGLSEGVAKDFFTETRSELVYLDTGLVPVPYTELENCSEFTGLSWKVEHVSLDLFLKELLTLTQ